MNADTNKWITRSILACFFVWGKIPVPLATGISRFLGKLWYSLDRKHRGIALNNLMQAFGSEKSVSEIHAIAEKTFRNLLRIPFEIGWVSQQNTRDLSGRFIFKGRGHMDDALSMGRGILALTAHVGNWEILTTAAFLIGLPLHVIYRPMDFHPLDLVMTQLRSRLGATMIPSARAMRKILRILNDHGVVAMLMDQNVDWYEGNFIDFFGKPACTNKGMAIVALRTKAPVVPVFLVREGNRFVVEIRPAIPLIETGDYTHDVQANTARYNQAIEAMIRRYPDQWFWVHQRWKTRNYCDLPVLGSAASGNIPC